MVSAEEVDAVAGVLAALAVCEKTRGEGRSTTRGSSHAFFMFARVSFRGAKETEQFRGHWRSQRVDPARGASRRQCSFRFVDDSLVTRASEWVLTHARGSHRCGQPGQQQGRRIPSLSCEHTLSTCCRLVSSFLTEMVQQIHSLRASGVMSSQAASAFASEVSAFRRSAGRLCTTPSGIRTVVIG